MVPQLHFVEAIVGAFVRVFTDGAVFLAGFMVRGAPVVAAAGVAFVPARTVSFFGDFGDFGDFGSFGRCYLDGLGYSWGLR